MWSDATIKSSRKDVVVNVKVTNTGKYSGKEVVELYVAAPKGEVEKPLQELKANVKGSVEKCNQLLFNK